MIFNIHINNYTLHVLWDDFSLEFVPIDGTNCNKIGESERDAEEDDNNNMDFDGDLDYQDWARVYKAILEIITLTKPWVFVADDTSFDDDDPPNPPSFSESINR